MLFGGAPESEPSCAEAVYAENVIVRMVFTRRQEMENTVDLGMSFHVPVNEHCLRRTKLSGAAASAVRRLVRYLMLCYSAGILLQ